MVEGRHFIHSHLRHAQIGSDIGHVFGSDPALLVLHEAQRCHHGGLALIGGIFLQLFVDERGDLLG